MGLTTVAVSDDTLDLLNEVKSTYGPEPSTKEYVRFLIEKDARNRGVQTQ